MCKKLILILAVSLLLAVPARAELSAWLLTDNDVIGGRLGYVHGNIEVGGLSYWWYNETGPPQVFGAYGVYHFPDILDVNNPISVSWLPATIKASGYMGLQVGINTDETKRDYIGPIAGLLLGDPGLLVMEYQYRNYSDALKSQLGEGEHVVMLGLRVTF